MSAFSEFACSVARTLDIIGEWWTMLILRDLFAGLSRFDEIQRNLGIASNILALRLKRLRDAGLVERHPDPDDGRRWCYTLTSKGRDLYPVIFAMMAWGDKWLTAQGQQPVLLVHERCGQVTAAVPCCSVCREPLAVEDVHLVAGPGGRPGPGTSEMGRFLASRRSSVLDS
jgi:DNA-binding HxlR family transcriptional regulator